MANYLESIDKINKELDVTASKMEAITKEIVKASSIVSDLAKNFGDVKTPKGLGDSIKDETENTEKLILLVKERNKQEKQLNTIKARQKLALGDLNKELIKERTELQQQNKLIKESAILSSRFSTELQKASVIRNKLARQIQDLNFKRELGLKLSDKEQKELKQSTKEFQKYDKAIRKAKISVGRFQENVGNYPKLLGSITDLTKGLIGSFGIIEGLRLGFDFAKEAVALAGEAKGVEFAFKRLGTAGIEAFENIKKSTRGLLSDLDIKRSLNEFNNFNISLEQTDTLFEFLAVRAAQTGRSVDSLKDSLVEGLSKESKLRIDNLGISAAKLNEELKKTPNFVEAVANIAKEEISKAGSILDDAASSQQKFNAAFENFKVSAGSGVIADLTNSFFNLSSAILDTVSDLNEASTSFTSFLGNISNILQGNSLAVKVQAEVNKEIKKRADLTSQIIPLLKEEAFTNLELRKSKGQVYNADLEVLAIEASLKERKEQLLDTNSKELLLLLKSLEPKRENKKVIEGTTKAIKDRNKATALSIELEKELIKGLKFKKISDELFGDGEPIEAPEIDFSKTQEALDRFNKDVSDDLIKAFNKDVIKEALNDLSSTIEQFTGVNANVLNNFFDKIGKEGVKSFEDIADIAEATFDVLGEVSNAFFQSRIDGYERDIEENNEFYNNLLENENLAEEDRKRLEDDRERKEKEIREKQNKEKRKQAEIDKAFQIAGIITNTARAVVAALPNVPLSVAVGAIGAAQLGVALATDIPQFAEGGTMGNDGLMMINDHKSGRLEVVERGNQLLMTDKKNAVVEGKKGDIIHKDAREYFNNLSDNDILKDVKTHSILATLQHQNYLIHKLDNKKVIEDNKINTDRIVNAIKKQKTRFNVSNNFNFAEDLKYLNRGNF